MTNYLIISAPGIDEPMYSATTANQFTVTTIEDALQNVMDINGFNDGFFFYKNQKLYLSTLGGPVYFKFTKNFLQLGVHAITIYFTKKSLPPLRSQFYSNDFPQALDNAFFYPLLFNHRSMGAIYSGNAGSTRTPDGKQTQILALNGLPISCANEHYPYDGYLDPLQLDFTQLGPAEIITMTKFVGDGILVYSADKPTGVKFRMNAMNDSNWVPADIVYTFNPLPSETVTIYLIILPMRLAVSTGLIISFLGLSAPMNISKVFSVQVPLFGTKSYCVIEPSDPGRFSIPFSTVKIRDGRVGDFTNPAAPIWYDSPSWSSTTNLYSAFPVSTGVIDPTIPFTIRLHCYFYNTVFFPNLTKPTSMVYTDWTNTVVQTAISALPVSTQEVQMKGTSYFVLFPYTSLNNNTIGYVPADTLQTYNLVQRTELGYRLNLADYHRFTDYPLGMNGAISVNDSYRNPKIYSHTNMVVPTKEYKTFSNASTTNTVTTEKNTTILGVSLAIFAQPVTYEVRHITGDDPFNNGVRIRKEFVDIEGYLQLNLPVAITIDIKQLSSIAYNDSFNELAFDTFSLPTDILDQNNYISFHIPRCFNYAFGTDAHVPTLFTNVSHEARQMLSQSSFTCATIANAQKQYSPWLQIDNINFKIFTLKQDQTRVTNFLKVGGYVTLFFSQCQ